MRREPKPKKKSKHKEQWVIQMDTEAGWMTIAEYWISRGGMAGSWKSMNPRSLAKCVYHGKMLTESCKGKHNYRLLNTRDEKETIPAEIL